MKMSDSSSPSTTFTYTRKFHGRELPKLLRLAHLARVLILSPIFVLEWKALFGYRKSRMKLAITLLNDISNATHGRGLEIIDTGIRKVRNTLAPKKKSQPDFVRSPFGELISLQSINLIVNELNQVGFSVVRNFVDSSTVKELNTEALNMPGVSSQPKTLYHSQHEWQRDAASGPRYLVASEHIEQHKGFQEIALNNVIQKVAFHYLGCSPILASTQVWTIRPPNSDSSEVLSEAAMAFHCDSDYFGFLKFFLLLTDVGQDNGPFTFVGASHRGVRHVAGRMPDSEIVSKDDVIYRGTGVAGDLVIADTKGWHKASPPPDWASNSIANRLRK